jgi:hypothetical protein
MPKLDLHCPFCPKTSSRGTGLASHIRGAHPREYPGWTKNRKSGSVPTRVSVQKAGVSHAATGSGGLDSIIAQLEKQRAVIEGALSALRQLGGSPASSATPVAGAKSSPGTRKAKRKGGMTPEGKARLIAALKRRWAAKKAAAKKGRT